ncbi:hypothetical protein MGYG_00936 [Nannizzia gypsea CBS 118893]|uniref:Uncharacterized protein n=1 Tax=Arthroderma gypseum (strain ATCC MYA-4604 / CBS 118893) TaxID=535722 RepID=E5R2X8_ARTGP|nr:hypothetical protein MGYG_00936 [Nannizzia gypsea CBS 118893]EFQ97899.1 hypothetical protein MGYG_00936 [Nannizzia gypsea CBS 118893]
MAAVLETSPVRLSPDISTLRAKLPYVNYEPSPLGPDNHAHPHESPLQEQQTLIHDTAPISSRWKTIMPTYGSRHIYDVADFSLWCEETAEFKHPTREQQKWVLRHYRAKEVRFEYPLIIVITDTPPKPLTLTIAGVAALFVPDAPLGTGFSVNTAYASPRVPDPSPVTLKRWMAPTRRDSDLILKSLARLCNIKAINWFGVYCYVELHTGDGRSYGRHSLPGLVAGKTTTYHHSSRGFWDEMKSLSLIRRIDPQEVDVFPPLQDRTNYLLEGNGALQPGVRLASSVNSAETSLDLELATSCGVLLRNSTGQIVVTAANHRMQHSSDVYHPSTATGTKIGTVVERWLAQDVAMVNLIPAVRFSNDRYFQATAPKRLVRSDYVPNGAWCSCDGMSTGVVFLHCHGSRISDIHMEVTNGINIAKVYYSTEKLYSTFGPVGGQLSDGICGAPIVEERSDGSGGGVCGLFRYGNESIAVCPVLDDIIDAGWQLY